MFKASDIAALIEPKLLDELTDIVRQAGAAIEAIRQGPLLVRHKADASPITAADEAAHDLIMAGLARALPGLPVISEESAEGTRPRLDGGAFALVDPLDGTREFVAGSGEFTVNIALIADGEPIVGVVGAPMLATIWRGARGRGAERLHFAGGLREAQPIRCRPWPGPEAIALVSRSHGDPRSEKLLGRLGVSRREPCGSAVKFCRLAEGAADIYPRLATTCEWDVAAGHAVLTAAGGTVIAPSGAPLRYGNAGADFRLPAFLALGDGQEAQRIAALCA